MPNHHTCTSHLERWAPAGLTLTQGMTMKEMFNGAPMTSKGYGTKIKGTHIVKGMEVRAKINKVLALNLAQLTLFVLLA